MLDRLRTWLDRLALRLTENEQARRKDPLDGLIRAAHDLWG